MSFILRSAKWPAFRLRNVARVLASAMKVLAHGFDSDMIAGLVREGLATAKRESMKAGGKTIEVVRIRITAAGREALAAED